jgi:trk system potassium uptake protein TrkH
MISTVLRLVGAINFVIGALMVVPLGCSLIYREDDWSAFLIGLGATLVVNSPAIVLLRRGRYRLSRRTGMAVVAFGWVTVPLFACIPFLLHGGLGGFTDCYFESVSGFTTTGSSILSDIEALPHGILLWRSIIQWLGGLGIVLLTVAFFAFLGVGGIELFQAEVPGVSTDKLQPRIIETARHLWWVYILITAVQCVLLVLGGMGLFDSICHSLTTLATGGFSPLNDSVASTSPYIQWVIIFFMFVAGTNFTLHYSLIREGKVRYFHNPEFRFYLYVILASTAVMVAARYLTGIASGAETTVREAAFTVLAMITTTGFANCDYEAWQGATWLPGAIAVLLMFVGGMGGSTGGGMKVVRIMMLLKIAYRELYTAIHPKAVYRVKLGGKTISRELQGTVAGFFFLYIAIFALGTLVMAALGLDFLTALTSVAATLNNIGPGLGTIGPTENFAHIPATGKWVLMVLMIVGRLELYTFLVILVPDFWRR